MSESAGLRLADAGAQFIASAFHRCVERLAALTHRARVHFERADWAALQRDAAARLDVYGDCVQEALVRLHALLGERERDRPTWTALRGAYARRIAGRDDAELAETFLNSVTRRIFVTIGVDPEVEFVAGDDADPLTGPPWAVTEVLPAGDGLPAALQRLMARHAFAPGWADPLGDAARVSAAIDSQTGGANVRALELVRAPFYRGKGAYLVGRLLTEGAPHPFVLALARERAGVVADAVLTTEDEVSMVFSFAHSYFFVDAGRPRELVDFLRAIMPRKPIAELYTAIGWNKHGKTELYRSLLRHLAISDDRFERSAGQRGMVMCVFTLPGFDVVFKVIRDRFDFPKTVTHAEVEQKYRLVFRHDRAGRLVDAQEFEHLEFDRARFEPDVLAELLGTCAERVQVAGDRVVLRHLYTERRLRPLDLHLREAGAEAARDAVIDYGQVLRDLAATDIFPGDMLLKNFGVSRHGRLIFYDYDELCPLSECRFRQLPPPRDDGEETAQEPWFYVGEQDIFPEEFRSFLGLRGELLQVFLEHHGELLGVAFWQAMQERHRHGEILDVYPYRASRRLRPRVDDPPEPTDSIPPEEPAT